MNFGLKIYEIYRKAENNPDDIKIVTPGFSFFAFLLPFFWAVYFFIWPVIAAILALNIAVVFLIEAGFLTEITAGAVQIIINFILGFNAGEILGWWYKKKGYRLTNIIAERNEEMAKYKYFSAISN